MADLNGTACATAARSLGHLPPVAAPGAWFLHIQLLRRRRAALEQALIVTERRAHRRLSAAAPGPRWRGATATPDRADAPGGQPWQGEGDLLTTGTRRPGRRPLGAGRRTETLLNDKFLNPIAGIPGGHPLVEQAKRPSERLAHLNVIIVTNLRSLLATSIRTWRRCRWPVRPRPALHPALAAPPMYEASWRLYVPAARARDWCPAGSGPACTPRPTCRPTSCGRLTRRPRRGTG